MSFKLRVVAILVLLLAICTILFLINFSDYHVSVLQRFCTISKVNHRKINYPINTSQPVHFGRSEYSVSRKCAAYADVPGKGREKPSQTNTPNLYSCGSLLPYEVPNSHDVPTFQSVVPFELYVTSAFFDEREVSGRVKVLGLSSYAYKKSALHCTLWYDKCKTVVSVKATISAISHYAPLQKPFKHLGYFFFCDTNQIENPDYVSLSMRPCDNPDNLLEIKKLTPYNGPISIAHCLSPLHGLYNPYRLVEWIAFMRVLGVDHIFVYDTHSVSSDVLRVLWYYVRQGFVTITRWHMDDTLSVRGFAQRTMLNDCAYKAYGKFMYISTHDLDEYIIPVKAPNLKSFLQIQRDKTNANIFVFLSAQFCIPRGNIFSYDRKLRTMKYTKRKEPKNSIMKMILRPEASLELGIHFVVHQASGGLVHVPDKKEAFVHHYRFFNEDVSKCDVEDKSALRFGNDVNRHVEDVCKILKL